MGSVAEKRTCATCSESKSVEDFHVDRSSPHGRKYSCRACTNRVKARWRHANSDRVKKQKSESYERNREKYLTYQRSDERRERLWLWKLRTQFSMTVDDWESAWERQNGRCAICYREPHEIVKKGPKSNNLCIDHDHETGMFRGLLCNDCNAGLGFFKDNINSLVFAIEYLESASKRVRNEAETA